MLFITIILKFFFLILTYGDFIKMTLNIIFTNNYCGKIQRNHNFFHPIKFILKLWNIVSACQIINTSKLS